MKQSLALTIGRRLRGLPALWITLNANLLAAAVFPDVSQLPAEAGLPDPLVMLNGQRVTSPKQWTTQRRPELKALFQHYMYGFLAPAPKFNATVERVDPKFFGGKATKKEVTIAYGPAEAPRLHLLVIVPNARAKPAPAFLGLNFHGNYTVVGDPSVAPPTVWVPNNANRGVTRNRAAEGARGSEVNTWNIEQSIDRGYAVATFYNGDLAPDKVDFNDGVFPFFGQHRGATRGADDWGAIAAWAWGFHRAMDYLQTDQAIDARRIAAVGHSRNGKAAMLAAAFDERIALVIPLQAGCGGTAPSRGKIGESVKQINDRFPHWFDDQFKQFNSQVDRLPFDQHCLIALMAPRPVLLANATEDTWANPAGQFEMLQAAEPVYRLLHAGGLAAKAMPDPGQLIDSKLGYFIRPGRHSMTLTDWKAFLDFADKQLQTAQ